MYRLTASFLVHCPEKGKPTTGLFENAHLMYLRKTTDNIPALEGVH